MRVPASSPPLLRYGLAVALTSLALLFSKLLPLPSDEGVFVFSLAAVILSAWYGGRGPGLLTIVLSSLAIEYFFIPPLYTFLLLPPEKTVGLIVFVVVALLMVEFGSIRRRGEQALRESEARSRAVFEHNPTMNFTVNEAEIVLSVNRLGAEQLGYRIEELVGTSVLDNVYEGDRETARSHMRACLANAGGPMNWELRKVRKDGGIIWVHETARAVGATQGHRVILIVCEEITDRKITQEELVQKASLLDLTHDTIFVRDRKDIIKYWNRGAEELYGWTRLEAIGRVTHELLETVFPAPLDEITAELFRSGRWEGELIHRKRDGSCIVVASRWSLQRDERGTPIAILETNNDTTERNRAEEALRRSEAYLAESQEMTHTGSWASNAASGKVIYWSDEMFRIFGLDPRRPSGAPDLEEFSRLLHADDRGRVDEAFQKAVHEKADFEEEYKVVHSDGTVRNLRVTGHPMIDKTGEVMEYLGTAVDVTERKRADQQLRESEKRHRQIFETVGVSIWEEDFSEVKAAMDRLKEEGFQDFRQYIAAHPEFIQQAIPMVRIVDVNDATVRLFGAESKDQILLSLNQIFLPETQAVFAEELIALAEGRTGFETETVVQSLKGQKLSVLFTITFPPQPSRYQRVLVSLMDITERKRVEQRLIVQHYVTRILAEAATVQDAVARCLEAICESLLWDMAAFWTVDKEADLLRCVHVWRRDSVGVSEFESEARAATFMRGIGLPGLVWFRCEPIYIPDVVNDATFVRAPFAARDMLHEAFGFPIMLGHEVLGVMELFGREARQPEQDLFDMMATIGSQIGQFIERKRAEETVRKTQLELTHVARVATLGELTASISHEINQPLGAIVNNAGASLRWLAAGNLEEARQSVEHVIKDGHRASQIITHIRDLVRKTPPQKERMDINETILDILALTRTELDGHRVAVQTELSDDVPAILGDRIQLQQVLLNIFMNAIEAMGGVIEGPKRLVIGSEKYDPQHIVVTVRDSGPGIDSTQLGHLFEAFYSTKPRGLGIGLAISRSIIEAHGGRLWTTPNEPRGATFRFTLPINDERPA